MRNDWEREDGQDEEEEEKDEEKKEEEEEGGREGREGGREEGRKEGREEEDEGWRGVSSASLMSGHQVSAKSVANGEGPALASTRSTRFGCSKHYGKVATQTWKTQLTCT